MQQQVLGQSDILLMPISTQKPHPTGMPNLSQAKSQGAQSDIQQTVSAQNGQAISTGVPATLDLKNLGPTSTTDIVTKLIGGLEAGTVRYTHNAPPFSAPLKYGVESEYRPQESVRLLRAYLPHGIDKAQWNGYSDAQVLSWLQERIPEVRNEVLPLPLTKNTQDPELEFLPQSLVLDTTGNVEVITEPCNSMEEAMRRLECLCAHFGAGSMQATSSAPRHLLFGIEDGKPDPERVDAFSGFLNFVHLRDSFEKLEAGVEKYQKNPNRQVARSFVHPWLAPISKAKNKLMSNFLRANAKGEKLDKEVLSVIKYLDSSFKYIGGTSFRPDIGAPFSTALEIRDGHKNLELMKKRLIRNTAYLQGNIAQFKAFTSHQAFCMEKDFEKIPTVVQDMVATLYPSRAPENPPESYGRFEQSAMEVYRNFAFPMGNYESLVSRCFSTSAEDQQQCTQSISKIKQARRVYLERITNLAHSFAEQSVSQEQAKCQSQAFLAQFSQDSGITDILENWETQNLVGDPKLAQHFEEYLLNQLPLQASFPKSIWEGPLSQRIEKLAQQWPQNVKVVEGVGFEFETEASAGEDHGQRYIERRPALLLTLHGLSKEDAAKLTGDYLDALSRQTISFPTEPNALSLRLRVGHDLAYTQDNTVQMQRYRGRTSILEPLVSLSLNEEKNVRRYLANADAAPQDVLGPMTWLEACATTRGKVDDNRPAEGMHNCSSWMTTAPIGQNNESLYRLLGIKAEDELHDNAGWFTSYLAGRSNVERVPYIAVWSDQALPDILPSSKIIHWEYDKR